MSLWRRAYCLDCGKYLGQYSARFMTDPTLKCKRCHLRAEAKRQRAREHASS